MLDMYEVRQNKVPVSRILSFNRKKCIQLSQVLSVVQRDIECDTRYGKFTQEESKLSNGSHNMSFRMSFLPKKGCINAKTVGLVQIVRAVENGSVKAISINSHSKMGESGYRVDQDELNPNPLYATNNQLINPDADGELIDYAIDKRNFGQHAIKKEDNTWTKATLNDLPSISRFPNSSREFEVVAIALDGEDKHKYFGSIGWGWLKDEKGTVTLKSMSLISEQRPSDNFVDAANAWNKGKTKGKIILKPKALVMIGGKVEHEEKESIPVKVGKAYVPAKIEIIIGDGKDAYTATTYSFNLVDLGDKETIKLPIPPVPADL